MDDFSPTAPLTTRAQVRLAEIRADISARLWPVNAGMTSASFNELMDQMARLQLNFELRASTDTADIDTRRGTGDRRKHTGAPHVGGKLPSSDDDLP